MDNESNLGAAMAALKERLDKAAREAVRAFYEQTGVTPSGIQIQMVNVTTMGDAIRKYAVGEVLIDLGRL